jgi:hypothetical protein
MRTSLLDHHIQAYQSRPPLHRHKALFVPPRLLQLPHPLADKARGIAIPDALSVLLIHKQHRDRLVSENLIPAVNADFEEGHQDAQVGVVAGGKRGKVWSHERAAGDDRLEKWVQLIVLDFVSEEEAAQADSVGCYVGAERGGDEEFFRVVRRRHTFLEDGIRCFFKVGDFGEVDVALGENLGRKACAFIGRSPWSIVLPEVGRVVPFCWGEGSAIVLRFHSRKRFSSYINKVQISSHDHLPALVA